MWYWLQWRNSKIVESVPVCTASATCHTWDEMCGMAEVSSSSSSSENNKSAWKPLLGCLSAWVRLSKAHSLWTRIKLGKQEFEKSTWMIWSLNLLLPVIDCFLSCYYWLRQLNNLPFLSFLHSGFYRHGLQSVVYCAPELWFLLDV